MAGETANGTDAGHLQQPPEITFGWFMKNIGKIMGVVLSPKKLAYYWNDDAWGPHVHLGILLSLVFLVGIIVWTAF